LKKNILLLGSSGFIGKNIYQTLLETDIFNINSLSFPKIDLTDQNKTKPKDIFRLKNPNIIMCAAVTRDIGDSIEGMLDNLSMVSNLSKLLEKNPFSHLIYISSVDVYGRTNLNLPLHESSSLQPSNYYGISKLASELILKKITYDMNIPFTVLRLPGVYGPGDTHNSPVKSFITSILECKEIMIHGDGSQLRDYLYIMDIGEIIKHINLNKITGTYNVVSGTSYRIEEIVTMISEIFRVETNIKYTAPMKTEFDLKFVKSSLLKHIPLFSFTNFKQGLETTCKYYKSQSTSNGR